MSETIGIKIDVEECCSAPAAQEAVAAAMAETQRFVVHEGPGICADAVSPDKYWERRCHEAEKNLQACARELERVRASAERRLDQITCLEQDNRMLSAQLEMVHLIFGHK